MKLLPYYVNKKYIYIAPGGFTLPYMLGICKYIKEHNDMKLYHFIGASAGSWLSLYLASDMQIEDQLISKYNKKFEDKPFLYKWYNICPFLQEEFPKCIHDHYFIQEHKIEIAISYYANKKLKNVLVNDYENIHDLTNLCTYSSFIPILSGVRIPKRGKTIVFDSFFTKPNFKGRNIVLTISNDMFHKTFSINDVIGITNKSVTEQIDEGYNHAHVHSKFIQNKLSL